MALMPKTLAVVTVATAGTRVPLVVPTNGKTVYKVYVQAKSANTNKIYLGDNTVAAANGIELAPGAIFEIGVVGATGALNNTVMSDWNIDAAVNGEGVRVLALQVRE